MTTLHSYPSIYALGHEAVKELFLDDVIVEEKVDGSQFSFGMVSVGFEMESERNIFELRVKSKGASINVEQPPKMFARAVATVVDLANRGLLHPGWTYRGEVLDQPHHNTLTYNRVPKGHIILFDINPGQEAYLSPMEKALEATRLGLEVVPFLASGKIDRFEDLKALLQIESCLGGPKIEGIVVKNYARFGKDKHALMGKWVREEFKEQNSTTHAKGPSTAEGLVLQLKTEARWRKAVQHLKENNQLLNAPQDIGPLLKEIQTDTIKEHGEEIKQALFDDAWKGIAKGICAGFPEWYKERLVESQFATPET